MGPKHILLSIVLLNLAAQLPVAFSGVLTFSRNGIQYMTKEQLAAMTVDPYSNNNPNDPNGQWKNEQNPSGGNQQADDDEDEEADDEDGDDTNSEENEEADDEVKSKEAFSEIEPVPVSKEITGKPQPHKAWPKLEDDKYDEEEPEIQSEEKDDDNEKSIEEEENDEKEPTNKVEKVTKGKYKVTSKKPYKLNKQHASSPQIESQDAEFEQLKEQSNEEEEAEEDDEEGPSAKKGKKSKKSKKGKKNAPRKPPPMPDILKYEMDKTKYENQMEGMGQPPYPQQFQQPQPLLSRMTTYFNSLLGRRQPEQFPGAPYGQPQEYPNEPYGQPEREQYPSEPHYNREGKSISSQRVNSKVLREVGADLEGSKKQVRRRRDVEQVSRVKRQLNLGKLLLQPFYHVRNRVRTTERRIPNTILAPTPVESYSDLSEKASKPITLIMEPYSAPQELQSPPVSPAEATGQEVRGPESEAASSGISPGSAGNPGGNLGNPGQGTQQGEGNSGNKGSNGNNNKKNNNQNKNNQNKNKQKESGEDSGEDSDESNEEDDSENDIQSQDGFPEFEEFPEFPNDESDSDNYVDAEDDDNDDNDDVEYSEEEDE